VELFEQHDMDGYAKSDLISIHVTFFMGKLLEFESEIEFVADINEHKDCLMSQDLTRDNPNALWFNIDIPKGHGIKIGDRVRVTVEKIQ